MTMRTRAGLAMGVFLTVCLIPAVGMLLRPETAAAANQTLAPTPRLVLEDGRFNVRVLNETADYVRDHLGFRQELISAHAVMNAALFQTSSEESVLLGRDGWLFYQETLDDYLHTDPLSQRQLYGAARTLSLLREYAEECGAELYVTVAPNKASLYPQWLPAVGRPLAGESNVERFVPLLEAEGCSYVDLFTPFRAREEILYYRTDSHWTERGAALAHDTLIAAMGKADQSDFFSGPVQPGEGHMGDLSEMLYPAWSQPEDSQIYQRPFAFSYVRQPRGPEDQRIETVNPDRSGSLLMFRDSFGNSLHRYMADAFGSAVFSRAMPYSMPLLEETGADTVLIEIVERNLEWLTQRAPIFPAPARPRIKAAKQGTGEGWLAAADDGRLPGYIRLEGQIFGPVDDDSPIYVQLSGGTYEASPVGEWEDGVPFTLYVEPSCCGADSCILYYNGGVLCAGGQAAIRKG